MLGNVDVCVATIPRDWIEAWDDQLSVPAAAAEQALGRAGAVEPSLEH
jgi:hypothetical protein